MTMWWRRRKRPDVDPTIEVLNRTVERLQAVADRLEAAVSARPEPQPQEGGRHE